MKRAPKASNKHGKPQQQQLPGQQPSFMQPPSVPPIQNMGQQMFDPTQALGTGMTP